MSICRVVDAGKGFPVVLAHGFPELAYSWRHQIPALVAAGHRVLAPDQRGYGGSSRPEAVEAYDITQLTNDLLGLLDDIDEERAVFVGHDWGAMVVWTLALLAPERVAGVVGLSVPFLARGEIAPIASLRSLFADSFFYILYFQEPGVADADLAADPARTMRRLLAAPSTASTDPSVFANDGRGFVDRVAEPKVLPPWLGAKELDHYIAEFRRTGFTGGLNWYRNLDRNWLLTVGTDGEPVRVPSLFIGGAQDPVLTLSPPSVMDGWLTDHRGTIIVEGAGHWVQQERPAEVNAALLEFVASVSPSRV